MATVRRWYIYLVCAISLQAVSWSVIALLRNLLLSRLAAPPTSIAFEVAVIVIGLPFYLVHWLWGQRLAARAEEERGAGVRRLYLYGAMAGFLGPIVANTFYLLAALLRAESSVPWLPYGLRHADAAIYHLLALPVSGALWAYHYRVLVEDARAVPEQGASVTIRRLYVFGFSAVGLTMTTMGIIYLLRGISSYMGVRAVGALGVSWLSEVARLLVGVPLWLVFWLWAQRAFDRQEGDERDAVLRKFYLYGAVAVGSIGAVANVTRILADLFGRLLWVHAGTVGDVDVRAPLSIVLGMGVLWAYHATVIRRDAEVTGEGPRQAGVRRLYAYLIGGTGLIALLIGLGGEINVIIRSLGQGFGAELRVQAAWFTAATLAGLPVWVVPWRQLQSHAMEAGPAGSDARHSIVRRIYLYLFLFIATMTALAGVIYCVYKTLSWALGSPAPALADLGLAMAYSLIAVGVWVYHGAVLRADQRLSQREEARQHAGLRVIVLDQGAGSRSQAIVRALVREMPGLAPETVALDVPGGVDEELAARLVEADLIAGPWTAFVPGGAPGEALGPVAQAVLRSPARKLLIPVRAEGWEWAGVDRWDEGALAQQVAHAARQSLEGEEVKPIRPLGASTVILIVIGVLIVLPTLFSLVLSWVNL
ncbi:MAG: hypothetical protein JXA09_09280 [Anaerolineae bacterium]|nr:hypothetical protein [Anaerolineae bacterium]